MHLVAFKHQKKTSCDEKFCQAGNEGFYVSRSAVPYTSVLLVKDAKVDTLRVYKTITKQM